jgi:probable rRNA maturation factor
MIKINVIVKNNDWKKYIKNPKLYLNKRLLILQKKINSFKKNNFNLSVVLSNSYELKKLNNKFRKKNKSTDILSFPFHELKFLKKLIKKEKNIYLGDVIINLNKVKKRNFELEFNKLWIHGLLHLFGHKHKKDKDYFKMQKLEKSFIKSINSHVGKNN